MRFLSTEFIEGIKSAARISRYTVEEIDRGTDTEMLKVVFHDGAVMLMHNQLPIVDGDGYVFVTTFSPPPPVKLPKLPRRRLKKVSN